jgi:PilZ domain
MKRHGRERRNEPRIELTRRATLLVGAASVPCLLQNCSGKGFFIVSNHQFLIGQFLELKCELYPGKILHCRVEVRHIDETCVGTKIVSISTRGIALLQQFLEEYYSLKLTQSDLHRLRG